MERHWVPSWVQKMGPRMVLNLGEHWGIHLGWQTVQHWGHHWEKQRDRC